MAALNDEDAKRVIRDWAEFSKTLGWQYVVDEMSFAIIQKAAGLADPRLTDKQTHLVCGEIGAMRKMIDTPATINNTLGIQLQLKSSDK